jgi:hypothetical protein
LSSFGLLLLSFSRYYARNQTEGSHDSDAVAVYDKKLKRGKDGLFVRYLGQNRKGAAEKFRLGYDPLVAEQRVRLIAGLWGEIEERTPKGYRPFWDWMSLEAAKAIAKGLPPTLPRRDFEEPTKYVRRVSAISKATGTPFEPMDPEGHQSGLRSLQAQMENARRTLSAAIHVDKATGVTVGEAIEAYGAHLQRTFTLPNGHLRPWGRTRLDQLDSIRSYLADEMFGGRNYLLLDLAELTYSRCDEIFGVFRRRPLTLRSRLQKRMAPCSAKNLIKELGNLFDWLDAVEQFDWTPPSRFHAIKKTPDELSPDEQYDRRIVREKLVIPDEHLKLFFEYSRPNERILLLLGLNCAFAASEIGQLRTGFLKLDQGIIEGIRFKSGTETRHWLWQQTRDGLSWVLSRRIAGNTGRRDDQDVVFLTERGRPIWHGTEKGHVSDGVSNIWYRLVRRVHTDHPGFPSYSFNKLRKTSASRILEIADAETASMILAHKTIGEDDLLHHYALLPWQKLYAAQRAFEEQLVPVLEAGGTDPWAVRPRSYIGLAKTRQVVGLRGDGMPASSIAKQLGISVATVYRILQAAKENVTHVEPAHFESSSVDLPRGNASVETSSEDRPAPGECVEEHAPSGTTYRHDWLA